MPPEIGNKTYTWLLILLQVVAASSWVSFRSPAHVYANYWVKVENYRRSLVISGALKPLLCTPATETLKQWQNDAPNDTLYTDGLLECMEWINSELSDAAFSGMSEEEQRSIDSWAFSVSQEGTPEPGSPSSEDSGCILCGVLVTQVGSGNDPESRFYWPTLRLLHLALRPVSNLTEAAPWILRSAEDAIEFCDKHNLRLDYSYLKLTFNTPELDGPSSIEVASGEAGSDGAIAVTWSNSRIDWDGLFEGLRSQNVYCENDYIPGAT